MKLRWFNKHTEENTISVSEAIHKLKIAEANVLQVERNLEGKMKEAKKQAEQAYRSGNIYQYKRFIRKYGESQKRLKYVQIFSAEIGTTLDTLMFVQSFEKLEDVASVLKQIHMKLGLETKDIEAATEAMLRMKEQAIVEAEKLASIAGASQWLSDQEFSELEKEFTEEFKAKMETEEELKEKAKEKIEELKEV